MNNSITLSQRLNWTLWSAIAFRIFSAISTFALIKILTPSQYAIYGLAISLAILVNMVSSFGFSDYLVSKTRDGNEKLHGLVGSSLTATSVIGLIALIVVVFFSPVTSMYADTKVLIVLFSSTGIWASISQLMQACLRRIDKIRLHAILYGFQGFFLSFVLICSALLSSSLQIIAVTIFVFYVVVVGIYVFFLKTHIHFRITRNDLTALPHNLRNTLPYAILPSLQYLLPVLCSLYANISLPQDLSGSFNVGIVLWSSIMMIAGSIDQGFYPLLTKQSSSTQQRTYKKYLLLSLAIALFVWAFTFLLRDLLPTFVIFHDYNHLPKVFAHLAFWSFAHLLLKPITVFYRLNNQQWISITFYTITLFVLFTLRHVYISGCFDSFLWLLSTCFALLLALHIPFHIWEFFSQNPES